MSITTLTPDEVQRIADGLSVGMEQLLHRIAGSVIDVDGTEVHSARALERRGLAIYSRRERRAYLTTTGLAVLDELARVAEQGHAILAGAASALGVDLNAEAARFNFAVTEVQAQSITVLWPNPAPAAEKCRHCDSPAITRAWDPEVMGVDPRPVVPLCTRHAPAMAATPVDRLAAELGAKYWTHPSTGQVRWYVDDWHKLIGLEIEVYRTGNISHATLNGETISNTAARRMGALTGKIWIDKHGVPHCDYVSAHVAGLIRRAVAEKLAALS